MFAPIYLQVTEQISVLGLIDPDEQAGRFTKLHLLKSCIGLEIVEIRNIL